LISQHHRQKVVEVVRDARCELPDRLQPLHLAKRGLDPLAFGNLAKQLPIGGRELLRALRHPGFQLLVEAPALVLPPTAAQSGLYDAHERGRMKRPLEERDVAHLLGHARGRRISFEAAAVLGQQDEGKIRPRRLARNPIDERLRVGAAGGLLGEDRDVGAATQLQHQFLQIEANLGMNPGVPQYSLRHHRVAAARREQKCAFGTGRNLCHGA
jgi:hypothetical protein